MVLSVTADLPSIGPDRRLFGRNYTLICGANFCFWAGMYCLFGAIPLYVVSLGGQPSDAGLVIGGVPLTSFVTQMALARTLARLPRVPVLATAPLVLPIGVLAAYHLAQPRLLVIASIVLGTGYTTFQTAATTLAADVTPPTRRGEALGIYGSFTTVALALGPALGIALFQGFGIGATFLAAVLLGVAAIVFSIGVRAPAASSAADPNPPSSAEGTRLDPIVYFCMFVNAGLTFTHGTLIAFLPLYAQSIGMGNPGLFYTVFAVAAVIVRAVAGRLSDTFGRVQVVVPATLVLAMALWALAAGPSVPALLGIAVVYAFGYGSLHPTNLAFAVDRAAASDRSMAMALVNSGFALGMGTGALVMGGILAATSFATMFAATGLVPIVTTSAFLWRYLTHRPPRLS
jgi:predicted MFS family arabinose efflux permease